MTNTKLSFTFPQVTQALSEGYIAPLHHDLKYSDIKSLMVLLNEKLSVIQSLEDKVSQLEQAAEAAKNQQNQEDDKEEAQEDLAALLTKQLEEATTTSFENDYIANDNDDDSFSYVNSDAPFPTESDFKNEYHEYHEGLEYDLEDDLAALLNIQLNELDSESHPVAQSEENQKAQDTITSTSADLGDETPKEEEQEQDQNDDEIDEETALGMDMAACASNLTQEQQEAITSFDLKFDEKKYSSSDFESLGLTSLASATKKKADLSDDLMLVIVRELNNFKSAFDDIYSDDEITPDEAFDKAIGSYRSACRDLISSGVTEVQLTDSIPKHMHSLKDLGPGMLTWHLMYVATIKRGLSKICA